MRSSKGRIDQDAVRVDGWVIGRTAGYIEFSLGFTPSGNIGSKEKSPEKSEQNSLIKIIFFPI